MTRFSCRRALLGAAILMCFVGGALGQKLTEWGNDLSSNTRRVLRTNDGVYLDANPQLNSGGYNYRVGGGGGPAARMDDPVAGLTSANRQVPLGQYRYEVTRSGTNRFNTPSIYAGGQRYRATRQYAGYDYHSSMASRSGYRTDAGSSRVNTRVYP